MYVIAARKVYTPEKLRAFKEVVVKSFSARVSRESCDILKVIMLEI